MTPRIAVPIFPGTNCEYDVVHGVELFGGRADILYHTETNLDPYDGVIIPGGFAHGDYLRTGAIARFSPIMSAIEAFAYQGKPVLGICNGFQILCEVGLLEGALQKNIGMKFICTDVELDVSADSILTSRLNIGDRLRIPINHFEGNYTCEDTTYERLVNNNRIILRYVDNLNGSRDAIAGIVNERGNVVGLMPHPERASEMILGCEDGAALLQSFLNATTYSLQEA